MLHSQNTNPIFVPTAYIHITGCVYINILPRLHFQVVHRSHCSCINMRCKSSSQITHIKAHNKVELSQKTPILLTSLLQHNLSNLLSSFGCLMSLALNNITILKLCLMRYLHCCFYHLAFHPSTNKY